MSVTKFVSTSHTTLSYVQDGTTGGIPLVFINSLGGDLRIWDGVIPHLAEQFPVIRYDKRGHGLSDCPAAPYTIAGHAGDLVALLDHLEIDEVILIGISVGGMIALDFASSYPGRVSALVLCDTGAKIGSDEMWNDRIDTLRQHNMIYLADAILARWFRPDFASQHPAAYRGYYNMLTRMPVEGYTGTCEAIRDADLRGVVDTIAARSLVLCGAEDASTPPDLVRRLADSLPDARFGLIDDAGHLPCIEQPDRLAAVIKRFLLEGDVRA